VRGAVLAAQLCVAEHSRFWLHSCVWRSTGGSAGTAVCGGAQAVLPAQQCGGSAGTAVCGGAQAVLAAQQCGGAQAVLPAQQCVAEHRRFCVWLSTGGSGCTVLCGGAQAVLPAQQCVAEHRQCSGVGC